MYFEHSWRWREKHNISLNVAVAAGGMLPASAIATYSLRLQCTATMPIVLAIQGTAVKFHKS